MTVYTPGLLRDLPVLFRGLCCDLHVETNTHRVWLCRVSGGVTVETYDSHRADQWRITDGACDAPYVIVNWEHVEASR